MGFKSYRSQDIKDNEKYKEEVDKIEVLYNQYKNKNEDELLQELMNNVKNQKEQGTFNYENIENMVNQLSSVLTKEQMQNIQIILNKIK